MEIIKNGEETAGLLHHLTMQGARRQWLNLVSSLYAFDRILNQSKLKAG
jgi:hypothetical protein